MLNSLVDPLSLRINIYFADTSNPLSYAPEGPGWYLIATRSFLGGPEHSAQEILPHVRLKPEEVIKIAKVLDKVSEGHPLNWSTLANVERADISTEQAVVEANKSAGEELEHRITEAEAVLNAIDQLKARVQEFKGPQ